ncbi:hypothetical protein DXG01_009324 [Tephrocybe rancida]|nr:hypothetical protein DXG01_009324 [Tephrocybe rancida]
MVLDDDTFSQHYEAAAESSNLVCTDSDRKRGLGLIKPLMCDLVVINKNLAVERDIVETAWDYQEGRDDKISQLVAERDKLTSRIVRLRTALSPQKRLPQEVLARIFTTAIEGVEDVLFPVDLSQVHWIILRVCSRWRMIARAEPRLWRSMSIQTSETSRERVSLSVSQAESFLQEFLPASGRVSFTLILPMYSSLGLRTLVVPYMPRMKKLHLTFPETECNSIDKISPQSFTPIEDLSFSICRRNTRAIHFFSHLQLFRFTKRLRALSLSHEYHYSSSWLSAIIRNPLIPFHQLKHLDLLNLQRALFADLLDLLRPCRSLESLLPPRCEPARPPYPDEDDDILPKLVSLTMKTLTIRRLPLTWRRLTTLNVTVKDSFDDLVSVLRYSSSLEILSLDFIAESPNKTISLISFDHLRIISILGNQKWWILSQLKVPQLAEIHMHNIMNNEDDHLGAAVIPDLISRSGCSLRVLSYDQSRRPIEPEDGFRQLLDSVPTLVELSMPGVVFDGYLLQAITEGELLPQLKCFKFSISSVDDFIYFIEAQVVRGKLTQAHGHYSGHSTHDIDVLTRQAEVQHRLGDIVQSMGYDFRFVDKRLLKLIL